MLTRKQHDLLLYIHKSLKNEGISPSFDEMKDALRLRSKSGIPRLVTALVERGFIRRRPHRARALVLLQLPNDTPPTGSVPPRPAPSSSTPALSFPPPPHPPRDPPGLAPSPYAP